jgi:hypothetical protein
MDNLVKYSFSPTSVGNHTLLITAKDNFGKVGTKSVPFSVTLEPPIITP